MRAMQYKFLSVAALAAGAAAQTMNLTASLMATPDLSNLTQYVSLFPQLLSTLASANNITILAPSNEAFAKFLNSPAGSAITNNDTATIQALLQYHVLNGTYPASAITEKPAFVPTLLSDTSYANVTGGQVVEAIKQGDSVVFYSGLLANSTVTTADTNFTGGVIHIIDTVLTVPANVSYTATQAGLSAVAGALTRANLVETVDSAMDLTIFAPNNAAFQAIGSATANLSITDLASILQYHVVNGTVGYSSSLTNGTTLTALNGGNLTVTVSDGNYFVNSAKVVTPDVLVAEGVVHVIDNVLNPSMSTAMPNPTASTQSVAFPGASSASDNPLTSGIPAPTSTIGRMDPTPASTAAGGVSSASSAGSAPIQTGAIGVAALFAGAGVWMNA
ncbi:MAG: hypothetical protein Q9217_001311 [Psora testacea]